MADQKINALPTKTTPTSGDKCLMSGAAEEYLIDYDKLATAILNKLTSKTFTLDQGTKTLIAAINELNSKTSNEIKFAYKTYPVDSFENVSAMLRQCADDIPSDSKAYIVRIVYGGVYTAIVQSYDDDTYRAVFAISYMLTTPSFQVKRRGEWVTS